MAYYQIEFVSDLDNKTHKLERGIAAPFDSNEHYYRLNWRPYEDSYEII